MRYRAPYSATWSIKFNIFHKIDINSINLTTLSKLKLHLGDQSALRFKLGLKSFFLQRLLHWANNIDTVPLQTNPKRKKLEQEDDFEPKILKLPLIYRQAPSLFAAGRLLGPWQLADRWIIIMIVIIIIKRSLSVCLCLSVYDLLKLMASCVSGNDWYYYCYHYYYHCYAQGTMSTLSATSGQTPSPTSLYGSIM